MDLGPWLNQNAISPDGEFSLISKEKNIRHRKYKQAYSDYRATAHEDRTKLNRAETKEEWKMTIDYTLRECAPKMGYRYVTNYSYLKR